MTTVKTIVPTRIKKSLEKTDLVSRVTQWLRGEIIGGRLVPGSRLPAEGKLALQFGVSRNVVREAMRNLRSQGLIEISQGRPAQVRAADPEDAVPLFEAVLRDADNKLLHLTEVRAAIEPAIAVLACRRRTDEDIRRMERSLAALMLENDRRKQISIDFQFHRILTESCRNPVYLYIMEGLAGLIRRSQQNTYTRDGLVNARSGHRAILDAIIARDEDGAREEMRHHLLNAEKTLLDNMRKQSER